MGTPEESAAFRRQATVAFKFFVVALVAAAGLVGCGWWFLGWWGLAGGVVLGGLLLVGGLAAGAMLYAMSQDGG